MKSFLLYANKRIFINIIKNIDIDKSAVIITWNNAQDHLLVAPVGHRGTYEHVQI